MNIIIISMRVWALKYLKECFSEDQLKNVTLITDKMNIELKSFLKLENIKCIKTSNLTINTLKKIDIKNSVIISAGSPWIFKEKFIKKLGKNFYNVHQSPLPSMRGSVASYIILYDIRAFQACLHRVTPGIDTGNVVYRKSFIVPSVLKTPLEINNFLHKKNREMVKEFVNKIYKKQKLIEEKQNYFFSNYNARLLSDVNGWIDWSHEVDDLDRFIRSYGDPYDGAKTFIHDKQVNIKYIEKSMQDAARHPDEVGRVLRKFEDYVIVSVNKGSIYIKNIIWKNKNIISQIKSGDKFYTKIKYLDLKSRRVKFINNNKKIFNQKTSLVKLK